MSKICNLHPTSKRYRHKCLVCHRINAKMWNRNHKDICSERNKRYQVDKKESISQRKRTRYVENPQKYKLMAKRYRLSKYGLSIEEYEVMLKKQGGACAICFKEETQRSNKNGKVDDLRVDHDHSTNKNRGLLCSKCNFGLGQFNDNTTLLERAIEYLKKNEM